MDRPGKGKGPQKPVYLVMNLAVGGEPLNPIDAYTWTSVKIVAWIKSVVERANKKLPSKAPQDDGKTTEPSVNSDNKDPPAKDPPVFAGVDLTTEQIEMINKMAQYIFDLKLGGPLYWGTLGNLGPAHHFSRSLQSKSPKLFKAKEETWVKLNFRNLYDALGAFLMVVGILQDKMTKVNFFLPLTAMYARWCAKMGGHPDGVKPRKNAPERPGRWPTVYQCTWLTLGTARSEGGFKYEFCLGASMGGVDISGSVPGVGPEWLESLLSARLDMLRDARAFDEKKYKDGELDDPPHTANSNWGNCAEAYPFTTMFREVEEWQHVSGVALQRGFFESAVDKYDLKEIKGRRCILGPCTNCKYMLKKRWDVEYETMKQRWDPMVNMT